MIGCHHSASKCDKTFVKNLTATLLCHWLFSVFWYGYIRKLHEVHPVMCRIQANPDYRKRINRIEINNTIRFKN